VYPQEGTDMKLAGRLTEIKRFGGGRFHVRVTLTSDAPEVESVNIALELMCGDYHFVDAAVRAALLSLGPAIAEAAQDHTALA
jgi:hypothetical protein